MVPIYVSEETLNTSGNTNELLVWKQSRLKAVCLSLLHDCKLTLYRTKCRCTFRTDAGEEVSNQCKATSILENELPKIFPAVVS